MYKRFREAFGIRFKMGRVPSNGGLSQRLKVGLK
jgi:hypothetical protein